MGDLLSLRQIILRDALPTQMYRRNRKRDFDKVASPDPPPPPKAVQPIKCVVDTCAPCGSVSSPAALKLASWRRGCVLQEQAKESAFWSSWRERVDKRPAPSLRTLSADDRMRAIKRRMLVRPS